MSGKRVSSDLPTLSSMMNPGLCAVSRGRFQVPISLSSAELSGPSSSAGEGVRAVSPGPCVTLPGARFFCYFSHREKYAPAVESVT